MANHKSAIKRMRQSARRRVRNRSDRSKLKTEIKKLRTLASEGKKEECQQELPKIVSLIDKTDPSAQGRLQVFRGGIELVKHNWLGSGPGSARDGGLRLLAADACWPARATNTAIHPVDTVYCLR